MAIGKHAKPALRPRYLIIMVGQNKQSVDVPTMHNSIKTRDKTSTLLAQDNRQFYALQSGNDDIERGNNFPVECRKSDHTYKHVGPSRLDISHTTGQATALSSSDTVDKNDNIDPNRLIVLCLTNCNQPTLHFHPLNAVRRTYDDIATRPMETAYIHSNTLFTETLIMAAFLYDLCRCK